MILLMILSIAIVIPKENWVGEKGGSGGGLQQGGLPGVVKSQQEDGGLLAEQPQSVQQTQKPIIQEHP